MTITQYAKRKKIEKLTVKVSSWNDVARWFMKGIKKKNMPESWILDLRSGEVIIYTPARKNREKKSNECPICNDNGEIHNFKTKDLESRTDDNQKAIAYVSPNKFPYLVPNGIHNIKTGELLKGGSFVLWWNTHTDIHEMSYEDNKRILELAAETEELFLHTGKGYEKLQKNKEHRGYFQMIKNRGKAVASSIEHGHYQIAYSNIVPKRIKEDIEFEKREDESFSSYLLRENPKELEIKDYGKVVSLIPESAMRRNLEAMILVKDIGKKNLHELDDEEKMGLAMALKDVTLALSGIMPKYEKEFAYNIEFHTGIEGMYIEILPYTQANGGFEKIGQFWACQSHPKSAAETYRKNLRK